MHVFSVHGEHCTFRQQGQRWQATLPRQFDCLEELTMTVEGGFPHHLEVCVCLPFPETSGSSSVFPSEPLPELTVYGIWAIHFAKAPVAHPSGCPLCGGWSTTVLSVATPYLCKICSFPFPQLHTWSCLYQHVCLCECLLGTVFAFIYVLWSAWEQETSSSPLF